MSHLTDVFNRRSFLRFGGLTLGGLSVLPASQLAWAREQGSSTTGKSVIFLFMQGGPSQFETFDPKPEAAEGIRTVGEVIPTALPGVQFGSTFKKLADHADKLAVVRSFKTDTQHGGLRPIVSDLTQGASLGAVYSRIAGTNNLQTGLPNAVCLFPIAVDPKEQAPRDRFGRFDVTGSLGNGFAPFVPGGAGAFQQNLQLHLPPERLEQRRELLEALDTLQRDIDKQTFTGIDDYRQQAAEMLAKGVARAFDLSKENPKTIQRYDTKQFLDPKLWGTKKNGPSYTANCNTLGKLLLLARRLAEAGAGVITINTEFVWDMHADGNNVSVEDGMKLVGAPFDHAVSAFIEDVQERGLQEKVLLVCCGEMGRTPKLNKNGGRDHWPKLAPLLLYGAGVNGQVVGQSTKDGGEPGGKPLDPKNLLSTIAHTLFDFGKARIAPGLPKEIVQMFATLEKTPGVV